MLIFVAFLVFGVVIGGLFSNFTEGRGLNVGASVIVGVIGSFGFGILAGILIDKEVGWYPIATIFSACIGAVLSLIVVNIIKK